MNPVPILMAITVHANIGGTTTPVGDPPNIIITSNQYILKHVSGVAPWHTVSTSSHPVLDSIRRE